MAVSAARAAAFDILLRVERESSYASELLHATRFSHLSVQDHGLATELVMGVLRWRSLLDQRLSQVSSQALERVDAEVLIALRLGVYQLQFLSKIPPRAAIFESVELVKRAKKRSAAAFVNAVLRKTGTIRHDMKSEILSAADVQGLAEVSAHPAWLVQRWFERFGFEQARRICLYDQSVPEAAIHIADDRAELNMEKDNVRVVPSQLVSRARRVQGGDVTKTEAYRANRVWIQDEASQLIALLVGRGRWILDCCAAPGGKTLVLASRNPEARVIASDLHPHRARLLRSLARRPNIRVIAADARQLPFASEFDRILADVPCSGTGTLAHNPEIKWRLKADDLPALQDRQIAILKSAIAGLAPGGRLVYSTCSLEPEENEAVVQSVLLGQKNFRLVDAGNQLERLRQSGELIWPNVESLVAGPFVRTMPGIHPCDGFFAAVIERGN